jgi:hypothetical protein
MMRHVANCLQLTACSILAEVAPERPASLLERLEPRQRVRVMAALVVVLVFGGFLLIFIRASSRIARWYVNRPERLTRLPGDPLHTTLDAPWRATPDHGSRPGRDPHPDDSVPPQD